MDFDLYDLFWSLKILFQLLRTEYLPLLQPPSDAIFFLLIPRQWQGHNGHNGVVSFFLSEEPLGPRGILGLATDGAT